MGAEPNIVFFFDFPEEVVVKRVLRRTEVLAFSFSHIKTEIDYICCATLQLFERELRCVLILLQGHVDDNIDTVKEHLKAFRSLNLPVVNHYSNKGVLYKVLVFPNFMNNLKQVYMMLMIIKQSEG